MGSSPSVRAAAQIAETAEIEAVEWAARHRAAHDAADSLIEVSHDPEDDTTMIIRFTGKDDTGTRDTAATLALIDEAMDSCEVILRAAQACATTRPSALFNTAIVAPLTHLRHSLLVRSRISFG